jgi:fatty-acyl-CoA synthase
VNSAHLHDLTSADRVLTTLPLFHVGGLNIQTTTRRFTQGASVVLHAKFDPPATIDAIERERITLAVLVPAQLTVMMESPRWGEADFSSLRMIVTGSTIVPEALVRKVGARGVPVVQVYGSTETARLRATCGRPTGNAKPARRDCQRFNAKLRVVDEAGRDLPPGGDGEILVRGASVMSGYWNAPEETRKALEQGWYRTGDIGHLDEEGYLYVLSRKTELIISGGENIYPAELENILLQDASIQEACVVGSPDERWGEVVVAVVVLKPGRN